MYGIVGYVGPRTAASLVLDALHRLEYRGYDSSGVATVAGTTLAVEKAAGRIAVLEQRLGKRVPAGGTGIAHTRWATHGPGGGDVSHGCFDVGTTAGAPARVIKKYDQITRRWQRVERSSS